LPDRDARRALMPYLLPMQHSVFRERLDVHRAIGHLRRALLSLTLTLGKAMTELDDVNAALDALSATVDAYESREADTVTALDKQIDALTAQLAAGTGLSSSDGNALLASISAISAKLALPVLTPATVTVAPVTLAVSVGAAAPALVVSVDDAAGHAVADAPLTFVSSDSTIATVDATGVVTGVAAGTATITVSTGGISAACSVTVS
jgi:trimeric autotransporter adhesin